MKNVRYSLEQRVFEQKNLSLIVAHKSWEIRNMWRKKRIHMQLFQSCDLN